MDKKEAVPLYTFDERWRKEGHRLIAGVDEAGRGPWAGPVVAAAVVLKSENYWPDLDDSKKLSPLKRERLFDKICQESLFYGVGIIPPETIDRVNILQATFMAMKTSLKNLPETPDLCLIDGNKTIAGLSLQQKPIIQGDGKSASIAAASIIAKVTRDRIMAQAHKEYPHYEFHQHKGYGTALHQKNLEKYGPCPLHRKSFSPIASILNNPRQNYN